MAGFSLGMAKEEKQALLSADGFSLGMAKEEKQALLSADGFSERTGLPSLKSACRKRSAGKKKNMKF